MQALATVPVATALPQQPVPTGGGRQGGGPRPGGAPQAPGEPLDYAVPDDVGEPVPHFFQAAQLAALTRLGDLLVPAADDEPGAVVARAPEFLDFLLSRSPVERQTLYRTGTDALNAQAARQFGKAFGETSAAEADAIVEPLRNAWSYAPTDPFEAFLRTAYRDLRQATASSRARAVATGNVQTVRWLRPL
ncbi:MAG: hypothetical protein ABS36_15315 [Acidobacteria bacterium SCN 69-37]|nr:MAG: hypothetical protein ABS36_15315 [Acidobacteria bacterium SCN 69-37]